MRKLSCLACSLLVAAAVIPCSAQEAAPRDSPRIGVSLGIALDFWNLPPELLPTDPELYIRYGAWESTFRYSFSAGRDLDLSLDARLAPRAGAYLPACGVGVRLRSVYYYSYAGAGAFVSVVPLRFDVSPLLVSLTGRPGPEVLLSAGEFRFGTIHPELFIPGRGLLGLFAAELTLLRVAVGF